LYGIVFACGGRCSSQTELAASATEVLGFSGLVKRTLFHLVSSSLFPQQLFVQPPPAARSLL